ncbi:MAG: hypothetical protein GDA51_13685 [Ekhidna sp.]|nr:hypothetical protein [Ekhidna sp.]MBC6427482.1 hypothetical protein [Ekhidna sp.]
MNAIEILSKLESVDFTADQARAVTEIFEKHHAQLATRDDVKAVREDFKMIREDFKTMREDFKMMQENFKYLATKDELKATSDSLQVIIDSTVTKAKYDLVRWIVGAIIVNGLIATVLKFFA